MHEMNINLFSLFFFPPLLSVQKICSSFWEKDAVRGTEEEGFSSSFRGSQKCWYFRQLGNPVECCKVPRFRGWDVGVVQLPG